MKYFLSILCFLIFFLSSCQLYAVEIVEHNGQAGLWFTKEKAQLLLEKDILYDEVELKAKLLKLKVDEMEVLLTVIKRQRDIEVAISDTWKSAFLEENTLRLKEQQHYESIIKSKEKWYKSPIFWGCVGFVVGSAATIAVAYSLSDAYNK